MKIIVNAKTIRRTNFIDFIIQSDIDKKRFLTGSAWQTKSSLLLKGRGRKHLHTIPIVNAKTEAIS